jgi:DNA end-binding protein Ku
VPNDKVGQDAFAVIRDAMKGKGTVGVGRVVISKRERPIILEPFGKGIRAMTLRYPYEVRKEDEYFTDIPDVKVTGEMLKLAEHIVETKTGDFTPDEFVDHYENAVVDLLKQKQSGKPISKKAAPAPRQFEGNIVDLLKKSMELEASRSKGKTKAPPLQPAMPKTAKKKARAS